MARVAVITGGYRGDVLPFVPVARSLAALGHEVRLVVPADFHPLLAGEPFDVPDAHGHDLGAAFLDQYAGFMRRWGTRAGGTRVAGFMLKVVTDHLDDIVEAIEPHAEWADLAVVHPIAALSVTIPLDRHRVPWVVGDLFPMLLPSAASPAVGSRSLGPALNRFSWAVGRSPVADLVSHAGRFKAVRRRLGLADDGWNLVDGRSSSVLNVGLFSRHYVTPAPDWPQPYEVAGFTFWDSPPGYELPDDVAAFLDDGPAPVLVCLGTSAASAQPQLFAAAADVLDDLGERGIFLTSTPANGAALGSRERHGAWPFVPLDPLLPRCRAVVHSGAHGTNAMALRAGLPSVIRPCLQDQGWHARRQEQLGTGVAVRGGRLGPAIVRALGDPAIAERAAALGQRIRSEDGPSVAAGLIDDLLR